MHKVVVIGGGTGTYTTLLGLKKFPIELSVIVSMMDSGGSNRVVRDEFGLLPTSDLRQVIVALADDTHNQLLRDLFTYRYSQGTGISGMTFGNLFMIALTDIYKSQSQAIEETCRFMQVKGNIIPVTYDNAQLIARYSNGRQVLGEHYIDEPSPEFASEKIVDLEIIPQARANPKAIEAIRLADAIVFAPGDLYTSLIPNLLIDGIKQAIKRSSAKRIYVTNIMTKYGQTDGFTATDFVHEISKYLDGTNPDYVILNASNKLPKKITQRYLDEQSHFIVDDLAQHWTNYPDTTIVRSDLISEQVHSRAKSDRLTRSLIRHDPDKLAQTIFQILQDQV
jgi:uncharacterized cofD-like protein